MKFLSILIWSAPLLLLLSFEHIEATSQSESCRNKITAIKHPSNLPISSAIETEPYIFRFGHLTRDAPGIFALIEPIKQKHLRSWEGAYEQNNYPALYELVKSISRTFWRQRFAKDPVFHGFQLRPFVQLPDKNLLNLEPLAADPLLHHGMPDTVRDSSRVEFHFRRDNVIPSNLLKAVWSLFESVGIRWAHAHQHIVVPFPLQRLHQKPEEALKLAEFLARVHALSEMISVIEKGLSLREIRGESGNIEWGSWNERHPELLSHYLLEVALTGFIPRIGNALKLGYIGVHFTDKYDSQGEEKLGVQFRSMSKGHRIFENLVDTVPIRLLSGDYGVSLHLEQKSNYKSIERFTHLNSLDRMNLWPKEIHDFVHDNSHPERLRNQLPDLIESLPENMEIRFLFYDWRNHPLNAPESHPLILREQLLAIQQIFEGKSPKSQIARDFLIKSGIYSRWKKSILDIATSAPD